MKFPAMKTGSDSKLIRTSSKHKKHRQSGTQLSGKKLKDNGCVEYVPKKSKKGKKLKDNGCVEYVPKKSKKGKKLKDNGCVEYVTKKSKKRNIWKEDTCKIKDMNEQLKSQECVEYEERNELSDAEMLMEDFTDRGEKEESKLGPQAEQEGNENNKQEEFIDIKTMEEGWLNYEDEKAEDRLKPEEDFEDEESEQLQLTETQILMEDFPGYPGWSRNALHNLLNHMDFILYQHNGSWSKLWCPPRTTVECIDTWKKLRAEVEHVTLKESIEYIKVYLMMNVPEKTRNMVQPPPAVKPDTCIEAFIRSENGGSLNGINRLYMERMFDMLPFYKRAEYANAFTESLASYREEYCNYYMRHPEHLPKGILLNNLLW